MSTEFLSTVSVFSELNEEELSAVDKLTTSRDYPKGSMVILEEEYGDKIFNGPFEDYNYDNIDHLD